ncbi:hypothetical protein [Streptomyces sp. HSG2]|uniref:hypothetical protein n=1 Tax=Streptomyces sp. HSG2 TaxID=2797167 RepID=UPI001F5BAB47|nr:hypothetical protein [Streptomyces sp. HSG2]
MRAAPAASPAPGGRAHPGASRPAGVADPAGFPSAAPDAGPGGEVPPPSVVPAFAPVRVSGARAVLHRPARHRRPAVVGGLVVAAVLVVAAPGPREAPPAGRGHPPAATRSASDPLAAAGVPGRPPPGGRRVSAPVRIADADTVALLRPGDRVDVVATGEVPGGDDVRVLARGARVSEVPEAGEREGGGTEAGALVVLSVARATAVRLAAAGTATRLAVTLW